ncbi:serine-rich adhesin for platelets-like isoform X3 [Ostrea edulis]|nr:serine-rich adhesin for platelets-like isoform X3 [Ostrea edulis]
MVSNSTVETNRIMCSKTSDNQPTLDKTVPQCHAITCPANASALNPENGQAVCTHSNHKYDSACITQCNSGYSLSSSQLFTFCQFDKQWSSALPNCKDSESPEMSNCPSTIFAYTDRNSQFTVVNWLEPTATDNSGSVDVSRTKGPAPGSTFPLGLTEIKYQAKDDEGNVSPECVFFVNVEDIRCDPPLIVDKYLFYQCPDGYTFGSTCQLNCMGSFPLIGNDTITCERNESYTPPRGYWNMDDVEPFCQKNPCDKLPPPENGAIICDTWLFGMQCQMQCSDKYDIPYGAVGSNGVPFTGRFTCSESKGEYTPSNTVPGCTQLRRPGMTTLIGEFFYYTGDCNDPTVLDEIKHNFINQMQLLEAQGWNGVCPSQIDCNVNNTEVTCGPVNGKKKRDVFNILRGKRSTHEIRVEVTMTTTWYDFNSTGATTFYFLEDVQKNMFNVIKSVASSGDLTVGGMVPDTNSFAIGWSDPNCPEGSIVRWSTLTCVPCAPGTYLDKSDPINPTCRNCPVATFKDNDVDTSCTPCPTGTSTLTTGSENTTDCLRKCKPGEYSTTGLEPCHLCPQSTYQNVENSTTCIECPAGHATTYPGSTTSSNCSYFDIVLSTANSVVLFENPSSDQSTAFSLMTWIFPSLTKTNFSLFQVDSATVSINVHYTDKLVVNINSNIVDVGVTFSPNLWSHLAARVNSVTSSMDIFVNGVPVFQTSISGYVVVGTSIIDNTSKLSLGLYEDSKTGYSLSGYQIEFTALSDTDIVNIANKSCQITRTQAQITMDDLKNITNVFGNKITLQSPSLCDNIDQCIPNPCNGHRCQDKANGYKCLCSSGYHGENCQNQPDYCRYNPCKNGGVCATTEFNFTCTCQDGYRGGICEIETVNGGWSAWGSYSECSASCGGGHKSRSRLCNSPVPDPDGIPCNSTESNETIECNTDACPSCPSIKRGFGNVLNCTDTTDSHRLCTVRCRNDLTFMSGNLPLSVYICGRNTSYVWNDDPPSCGRIFSPSRISIVSTARYRTSIPCVSASTAAANLKSSMEHNLQCSMNRTCSVDVNVPGCLASGRRRRRSTTSDTQTITLSYNLTAGDNLDLQVFYESNTVSQNLQDLLLGVSELEASASQINSSHSILLFELNGVQYTSEAVSTEAIVECSTGQGRQEAFCIVCPPGTHAQSNSCSLCPSGSYQDEDGQTSCKPCPEGLTSPTEGSQNISDCSVLAESTSATSLTSTTTDSPLTTLRETTTPSKTTTLTSMHSPLSTTFATATTSPSTEISSTTMIFLPTSATTSLILTTTPSQSTTMSSTTTHSPSKTTPSSSTTSTTTPSPSTTPSTTPSSSTPTTTPYASTTSTTTSSPSTTTPSSTTSTTTSSPSTTTPSSSTTSTTTSSSTTTPSPSTTPTTTPYASTSTTTSYASTMTPSPSTTTPSSTTVSVSTTTLSATNLLSLSRTPVTSISSNMPDTTLESTYAPTKTINSKRTFQEDERTTALAVIITCTIIVIVVSTSALSILVYKKWQRARHRMNPNLVGSWVSLNMVKPQRLGMPSKPIFNKKLPFSDQENWLSKPEI